VEASVATDPMSRVEIMGKIRTILAEVIDDDGLQLTESTTSDDVPDWDSLSHMKLMVGLESELGLRFEVEEISGITGVRDLIDIIQRRMKMDGIDRPAA
jgi:acyl carrier protein